MPYTREMFEKAQEILAARHAEAERKAELRRKLFEKLPPLSAAELLTCQ